MIDPTTLASIHADIRNADDMIGVVQDRIVAILRTDTSDNNGRSLLRLATVLGRLTSIRERIGDVCTNPVFTDTRNATS